MATSMASEAVFEEYARADQSVKQRGGGRKSKPNELDVKKKKKQPQRGMGVAQLERLRLQDRWKKMTQQYPLNVIPSQCHDYPLPGLPVSDPMTTGGQLGLTPNQVLLLQRLGNGGFSGRVGSSGFAGAFSDQCNTTVDLYGDGAPSDHPSSRATSGVTYVAAAHDHDDQTSKELSYSADHCVHCHKKKRINVENPEHDDYETTIEEKCGYPSTMINGSSSLIFNLGTQRNINEDRQLGSGLIKAASHARYAGRNADDQGSVEVDRKGISSSGGSTDHGVVFMEYEFIPAGGLGTPSTEFEHLGFSEGSVAAVGGAGCGGAGCFVTSRACAAGVVDITPSSIDLSLKLSY